MKPVNNFLVILLALCGMPQLHALELSSPSAINPNRLSDRFGNESRVLTANQSPMFEWDTAGQTFTSFDLKLTINNSAIVLPPGWTSLGSRKVSGVAARKNDPFKFSVGKDVGRLGSRFTNYFITTSLGKGIPTTRDANGNDVPAKTVSFTDVSTLILPAFYGGNSEGLKFDLDLKETDEDLNWVSTEIKLLAKEVGTSNSVLVNSVTYNSSFSGEIKYDLSKDATNKALDENKKYELSLVVTTTKGGQDLPAGMTVAGFNAKYSADGAVVKISNVVLKDSKSHTFTSTNSAEATSIFEIHGIPGTVTYLPEDMNALAASGTFTYKNGDGATIGTATIQNTSYYPMFDPYTGPDSRTDNVGVSVKCELTGHTALTTTEKANLSLSYSGVSQSDVAAPVVTDVKAPFPAVVSANVEFTSDEAGIAYYVAIPKVVSSATPTTSPIQSNGLVYANSQPTTVNKSDFKPSAIQIIAGRDFLYEPAVIHGQISMRAGVNTISVSGLDPSREYEVYIAVRDLQGNIYDFSNRWFQMSCPSAVADQLPIFFGSKPPTGPEQGLNISPMMFWKGVPRDTHHFRLTMRNLDEKNRLHWNVTNIPYDPITKSGNYLPEDIANNPVLGVTFGTKGMYAGPFSDVGITQKYKFVLSAFSSTDKELGSCDLTLKFTNRVEQDTLSPAIFGIGVHKPLTDSNNTFSFVPYETATGYWVVLEDNLPPPTKSQIIGGLDSQFNVAAFKGTLPLTVRNRATVTVSGLEAGKNYTIYVAVRDETGNIVVVTNHSVGMEYTPVSSDVISETPLTILTGKAVTVKIKLKDKPLTKTTVKPFDNPDVKFYTESLTFDPTNFETPQDFTFVVRNPNVSSVDVKFGIADGYSYIADESNTLSLAVQPVQLSAGATHFNFQKGWNLIGVPYIDMNRVDFGYGAAAGTGLADLWDKITKIYKYDLTLTGGIYSSLGDSAIVPINSDSPLTSRRGYWVFVKDHLNNPNVVVSGVRDTQPLVDFGPPNYGISQALAPFRDWVLLSVSENYKAERITNKLGNVWKWDQYDQVYVQISDEEELKPGVGYWVFAFMKR